MAIEYILQHTAEEMDDKLYLIKPNKNLLPYPYTDFFQTSVDKLKFTDDGDGTIIIDGVISRGNVSRTIQLTTLNLEAGTYTISANTTNSYVYLYALVGDTSFNVSVSQTFTIPKNTNIVLHMYISENYTDAEIKLEQATLKPQIEKGTAATTWVPYITSINDYVDQRFAKVVTKMDKLKEERGNSGVYVGSGEMPEDYNVQIDLTGDVLNYNPVNKTAEMQIPVGVDETGKLWTTGGSSENMPDDGTTTINCTIPRIVKTSADTRASLEANKFYVFPEMSSLIIDLVTPSDVSIVNEYKFRFTSGATATTLSLPLDIIGNLNINPNKIYEISIVDNLLISQSWEVAVDE